MTTLLVIGGTGFFGKSILDSFCRGQLEAWGVDKVIAMSRNAGQLRIVAPQLLVDGVELIDADIRTANTLPEADYVIHAAASTDARNYIERPLTERSNIQDGVKNYFRLASIYNKNSKVVYVSSGAVYGIQPKDSSKLHEDDVGISLEKMPGSKRDYAIAKRESEKIIMNTSDDRNLNVSIARCFSFVGPWLPRDQHFAIGNFLLDGFNGRPIRVNASHRVYRSYMHADDLVRWLMTIASNSNAKCEIYNVGSDIEIEIRELANLIGKEFGVPIYANRSINGDIDRYVPCIRKAYDRLGLKIEYDIVHSIKSTIKSMMIH